MGEQKYGDIGIDRLHHLVRTDRAKRNIGQQRGNAFGDIKVGRKIAGFGQDELAVRPGAKGRDQKLEDIDRGGIRDHDFPRTGADQRGNLVAHAPRRADPVMCVPAPDQAVTPFLPHDLVQARRGLGRQRAQGIAVEINDVLRQCKALPECADRIRLVQRPDEIG